MCAQHRQLKDLTALYHLVLHQSGIAVGAQGRAVVAKDLIGLGALTQDAGAVAALAAAWALA